MSLLVPRGLVNGTEFLEDRKRSSWRRSFLSHIPARMGAARRRPYAGLFGLRQRRAPARWGGLRGGLMRSPWREIVPKDCAATPSSNGHWRQHHRLPAHE